MAKQEIYDLVVIGGGPGGYIAAIVAAQAKKRVALVEALHLGGTCLNVGCIPTKALIAGAEVLHKIQRADDWGISVGRISFDFAQMTARKDRVVSTLRQGVEGLMKANGIDVFRGYGKLDSPQEVKILGDNSAVLRTHNVIVATGSEPLDIPAFPFDGERIHSSTSILDLTTLPRKLVIVGGGWIGCEAASLYRTLGVDVVILEMLPSIVANEGGEIAKALTQELTKQGIEIRTEVVVQGIDRSETGIEAHLKGGDSIQADMALVAVGRALNTKEIGLEKVGVVVSEKGAIAVNDRMETNIPGVYAIGDITAKWMLAHAASHQGVVAAHNVCGTPAQMHYNAVPSVIFTHPEVATVGMNLEKAQAAGYAAAVGKIPYQAIGKAIAAGESEGFARVVIDRDTHQVLGAQVIGEGAANLIATMTMAMANELTVECVADTIFAHPTTAEVWHEATLAAIDRPLNFPPKQRG